MTPPLRIEYREGNVLVILDAEGHAVVTTSQTPASMIEQGAMVAKVNRLHVAMEALKEALGRTHQAQGSADPH